MLHVTLPRHTTGPLAPVTTPDHRMGWLIRQLDHQPATGCKNHDRKTA